MATLATSTHLTATDLRWSPAIGLPHAENDGDSVTVGYSDTFGSPRWCHCNRRPLHQDREDLMGKGGVAGTANLVRGNLLDGAWRLAGPPGRAALDGWLNFMRGSGLSSCGDISVKTRKNAFFCTLVRTKIRSWRIVFSNSAAGNILHTERDRWRNFDGFHNDRDRDYHMWLRVIDRGREVAVYITRGNHFGFEMAAGGPKVYGDKP